jgi:hypothetical protein
MKDFNLDSQEKELLKSLESDEWNSVENLENEIQVHQNIAKNTLTL